MLIYPALRRIPSALMHLFNSAGFFAPLTKSLVLERGTGSPTFTRATTATVTDNEGVLRTAIAGEARFTGARRVRNRLSDTEDFSSASWAKINGGAGSAPTVTSGFTDPDGGSTAWRLQADAGGVTGVDYSVLRQTISTAENNLHSIYIKSNTASSQVVYFGSAEPDDSITATTSWQRLSILNTTSSPLFDIGCYRPGGAGTSDQSIDVLIWHPQLEDITGRTDQTTPSEYVSVGVLSAPYHGAGVDGVKYFDTDLSGNPIAASTMKGYLSEPAATNVLLHSNDLSNAAWSKPGPLAIAQNEIGVDGAISAWTLTDDNVGVDENINQASVKTAATWTDSCYFKKTTGAQATYPVFYAFDGATRVALCTVDTTNGVATVWTAYTGLTVQPSVARCRSSNDDKWFVELSFTATAATWTTTVDAAGTTNATQSTGTLNAALTGSCVVERLQSELGSFATSYIPTTTTAVARNADVLTYPSAGNISGTVGWCYAEASVNVGATPNRLVTLNSATQINALYAGGATVISMYDGSASLNGPANSISSDGLTRKYASTWNATGTRMQVAASGTAGAAGTFDGDMTPNEIRIGGLYLASNEWNGNIKNVRIGQRQLSSSELQAITR